MVLKAMLKKIGTFDIVMAKDGKEALDILSASDTPVGLILTDMWMPVMDGEGLVRAVHENKNLASIPVYVVTADTEMQGKYSEQGFDGIQRKITVMPLGRNVTLSRRPSSLSSGVKPVTLQSNGKFVTEEYSCAASCCVALPLAPSGT